MPLCRASGRQLGIVALALIASGAVVLIALHFRVNQREDRISELKKLVADLEDECSQAVVNYRPKTETRIDDLTAPVADVLRQLPGVVQVEVAVRADPTHRIVHLRDWHFVPRDLYALDSNDEPYEQFLLKVDAVQLEQMALLRCLIKHHGLRRTFAEGLTTKDLPNYKDMMAVLRDMEKNQIPELRELLTKAKTERHKAEITEMIDEHTARLLELGAAGRLLIAGQVGEVLPLDDAEALEQAKPIAPDGRVQIDCAKLTVRHDAQVRAVLDKGPFGLIVLGGAHDLSDSVRRLGQNHCEYIKVTTRRVREFSD